MAISLKYLVPIEEIELCIQPVGGLLETKEGPVPESMNDTSPSFWNPRLILEFTGLFKDAKVSWYWMETSLSPL